MNLRSTLALALVLGAASAYANDTIVGGTLVDANDPVASTTVLVTDGNYICTGSIIDVDLVVTAAHCVAAPAENLRIVFVRDINAGTIDKSAVLPISNYVANPGWQGDNSSGVDQHDIALIRVVGALPAGYHPATLLSSDDSAAIKKGDTAELAGYGITNATTQDGAGTLREVSVKVSKQLGQTEVVLDQRNGKGACHGDSGGPAFAANGQLWGVTNRGYPDNAPDDCKEYAVYTRITAYADFLSQAAAQLRAQQ